MEESVVIIRSKDDKNSSFGTGFIVYRDPISAYVVTCAHVIKDVGGSENICVAGLPAEVVALGEDDGFDLAVLQIKGLQNRPFLKLCDSGEKGTSFIIIGFFQFSQLRTAKNLVGTLGDQVGIESKRGQRTTAWDLTIHGENYLQRGYSGSPVIHQREGYVLGVVSHLQGKGEKGLAISIKTLKQIWRNMPSLLSEDKQLVCKKERSVCSAPDFPDFFGRTKELEILFSKFQTSRILLVNGEPGVGKTHLVAQLAKEISKDYRIVWLEKNNLALDDLMFSINEVLKEDGRSGSVITFSEEEIDKIPDKIPILVDIISSSRNPKYVLFIDNFQRTNQSELISFIERFSTHRKDGRLILISNLSVNLGLSLSKKIQYLSVKGFQDQEAIEYIEYVIKCSQEHKIQWTSKESSQIIERTAGHPLAMNLIIQCCAVGVPLDRVLENLLDYSQRFGGELHQKLLADVAAYLSPEEEKAMHRLAVFKTPVQRSSWNYLNITEEIGEALLQKRLLTLVDINSFQMHPVVREFWWKSFHSEKEKKIAHEKAAYYYWEQAKKSFETVIFCHGQKRLNFNAYSEAYYHFSENAQPESLEIIEEFICATYKQERLLGLPSLKAWLPELNEPLIANKPWIFLETARKFEKDNTEFNRKKAELLFSQSYDIFCQLGDSLGTSIALYYKGKILHLNNQPESALEILKLVLEGAETRKDIPMQIRTLAKLISCYTDLHQYDNAGVVADRAELLARNIGDQLGHALILYRKGSIERHRSNFEEAEKYFSESAEAFKALEDRYRLSKSLSRLGLVQDKLGKYTDAISNLENAIEIKESLSDEYGLALDLDYLGDVYRSQGLHKKANEYYLKSLEIKEKRRDTYGIVKSCNNLARNSLLSGSLDEVDKFLQQSKNGLEQLKQKNEKYQGLEGAFLNVKGDLYFKRKQYKEAIEFYKAAQSCFVSPQHSYARVSLSLGRTYLELRDFKKSKMFLDEALNLFRGNLTPYHEALTLNYLARLEILEGNFENAEAFYRLSIKIAKKIDAKDIVLSSRETEALLEILKYYYNDFSAFNDDAKNDEYKEVILSTYIARVLTFSSQLKEAIDKNNRAIEIMEKIGNNEDILMLCNETKGIIEEGIILESFQFNDLENKSEDKINKEKEKLINKVWREFDKALPEFIIKKSVHDIARLQIKKNLWRLIVKLLINQSPFVSEEDYKSLASLEVSFSKDILEEVMFYEVLNVKYTLLTSSLVSSTLVERKACYFLKILSPVVDRLKLNINLDLTEMEQLAFSILYPNDLKEITNFLKSKFCDQENFALKVKQEVEKGLKESKIPAEVFYRNKSPYSIYRKKTERKGVTLGKILDFVGFRIITKTVDDCYRALDIVNSMGKPFKGKGILTEPYRDYIDSPKKNTGYQSIYINIEILPNLDLYGETHSHIVEFQIRTQAIHVHAEMGESSHSYYKDVSNYSKPDLTKNFQGSSKGIKLLIECEKSLIGDIGKIIQSQDFDILSVDIKKTKNEKILLKLELRSRNQSLSSTQENSSVSSLIHSIKSLSLNPNKVVDKKEI